MNIGKAIDKTFISISMLLLIVVLLFAAPSLNLQIALLFIGSLIIGLPHGAMDYEVGKHIRLCDTAKKTALFFVIYTLIALANYGLWLAAPFSGFLLFLILSILHFSEDWEDKNASAKIMPWVKKLSFATAFLCLPSILHAQDLKFAFSALISETQAEKVIYTLEILSYSFLYITLAFTIIEAIQRQYMQSLLSFCFIASAILLPPILFLFLYFCVLHGPRHTLELYETLNYNSFAELIRRNILVIALTGMILVLALMYRDSGQNLIRSSFATLIIYIACLTTPHMLRIGYMKLKTK